MTEYTIAAISTVYRGRQYRSRLEARWAAFFDLLSWEHEYEPFDLGSWSPDFLLTRRLCDADVLVEVKPFSEFSTDVAAKMERAAKERGLGPAIRGLLLTSVAPTLRIETDGIGCIPVMQLGWFGSYDEGLRAFAWSEADVVWIPGWSEPRLCADIRYFPDPQATAPRRWFSAFERAILYFTDPREPLYEAAA